MDNNIYEMINKYAKEVAALLIPNDEESGIIVKVDGAVYETTPECHLGDLRPEEVVAVDAETTDYDMEYQLLMDDNEINAVICSETPYCLEISLREEPMTAALDDMAQIVGYQVKRCDMKIDSIREALKHATGCFVDRHRYTITTGRSLYEAMVALTVLEKSAEVNLKAEALGGAKPLPKIEAGFMRMIYKKKYSVAEQEVKSKEGDA